MEAVAATNTFVASAALAKMADRLLERCSKAVRRTMSAQA